MKKLKIKADTTLKYLQVFNGILELTYRELQVLSKLIDLSKTVDLCSVINKRSVAKRLVIVKLFIVCDLDSSDKFMMPKSYLK